MNEGTVKDVLLEILSELREESTKCDVGSESYNKIMTEIHKVTNDINEIEKNQVEADKLYYQRDRDFKDRIIRGIEVAGKIVIPIGLAIGAFYFEKEDSFTSTIGRRLFGNAIPKM